MYYFLIDEYGKISNKIRVDNINENGLEHLILCPYTDEIDLNPSWWTYNFDTKILEYTPPDLNLLKQNKKNELSALRWLKQNSGTTFNGIPMPTDSITQTNILGATIPAQLDPTYTVQWKTPIGFITLDAQTIILLAQTIRTYIQNCYSKEAEYSTLIDEAADEIELNAIDLNANWP